MNGFVEKYLPGVARRYYEARLAAITAKRFFEAAEPSAQHPRRHTSSADAVNNRSRDRLMDTARWLDENSDIAISVLDTLVNRTVGAGLTPAPMVLNRSGELYDSVNDELAERLKEWSKAPDTTQENPWSEVQRLQARSLFRDGEVFVQHVFFGNYPFPPGALPYLIQSLEADFLPHDILGIPNALNVVHGVEKGIGGIAIAYHILREQPNAVVFGRNAATFGETIRVPAEMIEHLKFQRRLHQTRGVSMLHGAMRTIEDVKEYRESERIAARVAAAFCAFIKKTIPQAPDSINSTGQRFLEMMPGIIDDTLMPGEEISTVGSNRPNPNMADYVNGETRLVAASTNTGYSTISRNYDGSYSSQRQEMVETDIGYERLHEYFVSKAVTPVYERWLDAMVLSGRFRFPRDVMPGTQLAHEVYKPPVAWIDPLKEVQADALAVEKKFRSRHDVIRRRHGDPRLVDREIERDKLAVDEPQNQIEDDESDNEDDASQEDAA